MDRDGAIRLLRAWREDGDEDEQARTLDYLRASGVLDDELEQAIERLRRTNPHIHPDAIREMVLADETETGERCRDYSRRGDAARRPQKEARPCGA